MRHLKVLVVAASLAASVFVGSAADAKSIAGLCVAFQQPSDVTFVSHAMQWNGSTWVWTQVGSWQRLPNGGTGTSCVSNINVPTYKLLYWWNYSTSQAVLWAYAASYYVVAAGAG